MPKEGYYLKNDVKFYIFSVTTSFASAYLMAMAAGNLAGRLGWAAVSDKIGKT